MATPPVVPQPEVTPEPEKVSFNEAQQAKVQEIIDAVKARTSKAAQVELEKAKAELEATKAERDRAVAATLPGATADEKLRVELDDAKRKNTELEQRIQRSQRENLILAAARANGFLNEDDALKFVDIPADADAAAIAAAVSQTASARPYLIKGVVLPGTGSGPASMIPPQQLRPEDYYGRTARPGSAEALNAMSRSNPSQYRALRAAAQKARLI